MPVWRDLRGQLPVRPGRTYYNRPLSGIVGATLHYTAGSPSATVEAINAYQIGPTAQEDFPAIAYHLVVTADGTVNLCHDLTTRVWHSGAVVDGVARNASHIGICYAGDVEPNAQQLRGLASGIAWCERQLGRQLTVEGHKDAPYATACPGPMWPQWRGQIT